MASETSVCQNSNLESSAFAEKSSSESSETSEEPIKRIASAETMSSSALPAEEKESCAVKSKSLSGMISQLVSIIVFLYYSLFLLNIFVCFVVFNKINDTTFFSQTFTSQQEAEVTSLSSSSHTNSVEIEASETSASQKSNMESDAFDEQQNFIETAEEAIARIASAETKSFSAPPTQECISDMTSSIQVHANTFILLHTLETIILLLLINFFSQTCTSQQETGVSFSDIVKDDSVTYSVETMASETSVCQKSNLESITIPEMPSTRETSEQVISRVASAEATDSCSVPPNQEKESSILPRFLSEITSQLDQVCIYIVTCNNIIIKILVILIHNSKLQKIFFLAQTFTSQQETNYKVASSDTDKNASVIHSVEIVHSEMSVNQKSNMESGAIPEMPSFTETSESEELITRLGPTETNSCSELPTEEKESCALEECLFDMTSQLVSIN